MERERNPMSDVKFDDVICICGHKFYTLTAKVRQRISDDKRSAKLTDDPIDFQCPKCLYWMTREDRFLSEEGE